MTIETLTEFLELCLLINAGLLVLSFLSLLILKPLSRSVHGSLFSLGDEQLNERYFAFLANFKLLIIVFNLTPYLALKCMT